MPANGWFGDHSGKPARSCRCRPSKRRAERRRSQGTLFTQLPLKPGRLDHVSAAGRAPAYEPALIPAAGLEISRVFPEQRVKVHDAVPESRPFRPRGTASPSSHSARAMDWRASKLSSMRWISAARLVQLAALDSSRRRPLVVSMTEALARSAAASSRHPATVSRTAFAVVLGGCDSMSGERFIDEAPVEASESTHCLSVTGCLREDQVMMII